MESLASLIVLVTGVITLNQTNSFATAALASVTSLIILIILAFVWSAWRKNRIKQSGILEIDQMSGIAFEEYLAELYRSKGYKVKTTPKTSDYGVDLLLYKDKVKIAVQAKRYKSYVGIKAVQEVVSGKSYYNADIAWVVTNSYFTKAAKKLAAKTDVQLIDRDQLVKSMYRSKIS